MPRTYAPPLSCLLAALLTPLVAQPMSAAEPLVPTDPAELKAFLDDFFKERMEALVAILTTIRPLQFGVPVGMRALFALPLLTTAMMVGLPLVDARAERRPGMPDRSALDVWGSEWRLQSLSSGGGRLQPLLLQRQFWVPDRWQ